MNTKPLKATENYSPDDIQKLVKFFALLWETDKEQKQGYEN